MMFGKEIMGVCCESGLLHAYKEDHGELVVCEIQESDFNRFGDHKIPKKRLGVRQIVKIIETVILEPEPTLKRGEIKI